MKKTLIVILGPTGVGKTDVCLRVAEFFHIPIINADSRQIFQEIPIGTAAPTPQQQQRVKHYMVANHQLSDYYSASMYEEPGFALGRPEAEGGHRAGSRGDAGAHPCGRADLRA